MNSDPRSENWFGWTSRAAVVLMLCAPILCASAGVSVSIHPPSGCSEYEQEFTVYVWIDSAGSGFDGYETVIRFDPADSLEVVSVEQGPLMTELCPEHPPWWFHTETDSSVFLSHVVMCGGDTVTGPGALSSITFGTPSFAVQTAISLEYIEFYKEGYALGGVVWHDGSVVVAEECVGACYLSDETCLTLAPEDCELHEGQFIGYLQSCNANPCDLQRVLGPAAISARRLFMPVPNPFTESTRLSFYLDQPAAVRLEIFDATGRFNRGLLDRIAARGLGTVRWDGADDAGHRAPPGVYYCRFSVNGQAESQRVIVLH